MAPPPRQQPADGKLGNISGTPAALSKWAEHYLPKVFAVDTRITGLIKRGSATDRGRTITLNLEHALCLMMGYLPKDLSLINPAPTDPAYYVTLLGSVGQPVGAHAGSIPVHAHCAQARRFARRNAEPCHRGGCIHCIRYNR